MKTMDIKITDADYSQSTITRATDLKIVLDNVVYRIHVDKHYDALYINKVADWHSVEINIIPGAANAIYLK